MYEFIDKIIRENFRLIFLLEIIAIVLFFFVFYRMEFDSVLAEISNELTKVFDLIKAY